MTGRRRWTLLVVCLATGVLLLNVAAPTVALPEVGRDLGADQSMLQWVRRGRMIRLTWRLEGRAKVASVSLVDGHVLDNWGRSHAGVTPARHR